MTTTTFNVRMSEDLKTQATQVFESYGLSPTQAIKLFFNQVVATRKVPLSFDFYPENDQPNATTIRAMRELDNGSGTLYHSLDDLLAEYGDAPN